MPPCDSMAVFFGHKSDPKEVVSLSWSGPRKFALFTPHADFWRYGCSMHPDIPSRIFRIHCDGTKLTLYTLLGPPEDDRYSLDPSQQDGFGTECWDSDLLESLGFDRLVSHARSVREAVGLSVESWLPNTSQDSVYTASIEAGIRFTAMSPPLLCETSDIHQCAAKRRSREVSMRCPNLVHLNLT